MYKFLFLFLFLFLINCSTTEQTRLFNQTITNQGKPKYYQTTTNFGIHFFIGVSPISKSTGNASFESTLDSYTNEAKKAKCNKVNIFHKETTRLWYILPPLTIIFTPIITELIGTVEE
jgi:hypothetical protein